MYLAILPDGRRLILDQVTDYVAVANVVRFRHSGGEVYEYKAKNKTNAGLVTSQLDAFIKLSGASLTVTDN